VAARSNVQLLNWLKRINGKFEQDMGIRIWGVDDDDVVRPVKVDSEGRLVMSSIIVASVLPEIDIGDQPDRELGIVYGDQGQLAQNAARDLKITLDGETVTITPDPRDRNWTITETITVQATDLDIRDITETLNIADPPSLDISISALRDALLAGTATYPGGIDDVYDKLNTQLDIPISTLMRVRVYDQDFESGTTDTTATNCTQAVQGTEVYAGSYALKVDITATQTGEIETPSRPVSPNQRVIMAFAHKEDANVSSMKIIMVWRRAAGGVISTDEHDITPSTSWVVDEITVSAPSKAATMTLKMEESGYNDFKNGSNGRSF